jgi:hypothetical protein
MANAEEVAVKSSTKKLPLGILLVMQGLIGPQELFVALDQQKHSKKLLGEILILTGALEPNDLERVLKLQSSGRSD